jgi:endo-1,4-beta-xylanase
MARDFKARGVPLDGIGLQMHVGLGDAAPDPADLTRLFARLRRMGLKVAVTEMDVKLPALAGPRLHRRQARVFRDVGEACRQAPNCTSVTVWGVSDEYSWIGSEHSPLPLGDGFGIKPAFRELARVLRGR